MSEEKKKAVYMKGSVATGQGILAYSHIDTPDTSNYGHGCWNCTILHPKKDNIFKTVNKTLREECIKVAKEAFPEVTDLTKIEWPWKDGDKYPKREQHAGMSFMFAKQFPMRRDGVTPNDPIIVLGPDGKSQISAKAIYWGCMGRMRVTPYSYTIPKVFNIEKADGTYETKTVLVKGISLLLKAVQFCGDGQKFKGGHEDLDFDAADGYASAGVSAEVAPKQDSNSLDF